MLPVTMRLSREQILSVSRNGKRLAGSDWRISWIPNGTAGVRAAIRVSTKITKLAVERNRMKRLLREAIRSSDPTPAGFDIVMTVTRNFSGQPLSDVRHRIGRMFQDLASSRP
jgi:ribonuclease P protein component